MKTVTATISWLLYTRQCTTSVTRGHPSQPHNNTRKKNFPHFPEEDAETVGAQQTTGPESKLRGGAALWTQAVQPCTHCSEILSATTFPVLGIYGQFCIQRFLSFPFSNFLTYFLKQYCFP